MKKRVLAAAIAAMCFVGTVPISVVPITGVAENVQEQTVLTENNDAIYGIGISKAPDKTTYKIGEQLDLTGLRLNGSYRNGELISTIIDEDYQDLLNSNVPIKIDASEFDNTKAGRFHIYVIYGNTKNSFTVTVYDDAITTTIAVTETKPVTTITTSVNDPSLQISVVTVTIMDISGDNILVKPVDGSPELKSSNKFSLSSKQLPANLNPKVGMKLEILYYGGINETYPAQFANVQKVVEVKEDTVKEGATWLKGTKDMTLKDVMRLAELGDELDWAEFKDYNGRDVGSGLHIWEYKLEDGYVLDVGGSTDKKPIYIILSCNNEKGIDIRTNDVKEYIASTATPVVTENEKVEAVMLTTEEGNDGCYIHLDLASGTFGMSGSIYQNFAIFGKFERKDNDLYLYAENGSTNVYVLHREDDHFISQSDERGIKLSKGLVFSAENDSFWEELFDLTPPENESNNTGKTQDYSFEDILNMSSDELNKLFESKGMTWDKGFKVFSPDNTLQAYSVCISPKPYMQSVKGDELVTEVKDANDIYKLFTDGDVIWNINKIYSSLGISPELFEIKANVSFTHAIGNEETGSVYRKYCRCFLTPITTDKETYNTLLAAALNYVQLNPDFVEIYFEAPGAGGGGMNIPSTVNIKGDANSNGNETCYSGGECEDGVMIVPETEEGKIVTEISLWSDDNIKALKIPATVNNVDIIKCLNLEKIEVSEDNPYLCSVDGVIYSKDMKTLVFYPSSKSETAFIVPDTVEVIREGAFSYAQNLKSVKLPYGVKIIKDSAFFGTKITDFELPETLTDIEQYAFSENNSLTSITLPASLKHAESPFLECGALTEIVILHEIGDEHFESSGPRNPDDDYYSALLRNGSNITVFVPDNSYEDYNKYYKDRWKCKNILPLSKYEKNTLKGDTNCDSSVDMADVVLIMQALANPNKYGIDGTAEHHLTEQGRLNADVDGDGLTVGDAQAIQLKLLGIVDSKTNSNLKDIVSIRTPYDPIMSNWSGIGILLEFDSPDYQITLFAEDGHFTYWDINKGSGPIKDVGTTYEVGKNGYIFWTPDDLKYPEDFETEIIVKGTSSNKSVELGRIYITGGERSTLIASLEKPDSAIDPIQPLGVGGIDEAITLISNYDLNNYDKVYHDSYKKMFERFKNDGFIYQVTENETIKVNNNRGVALFPYARYEDIGVGYYVTFKEKNYHIMFYYADTEVLTETDGIAEYLKKRMGRSSDKIVKIQDKDVSLLFPENGQCYANAFIDENHYFDVIGAVSEDELIEFLNAFEYGKLNLKSDKRLKLIDSTIKSVNVTSLPKGYDFTFTDSKAQKFIDFLSDMELTDDFSEDPGQLNGMTWVIKLEYQNNDTMTLYDIGGYIRSENDSWLKYEYDYDSPLDTLIWELSK